MDQDELMKKQIDNAVDRLDDKHPEVPREKIEQVVADVQDDFKDAPVREHLPNLIHNEGNKRLKSDGA